MTNVEKYVWTSFISMIFKFLSNTIDPENKPTAANLIGILIQLQGCNISIQFYF